MYVESSANQIPTLKDVVVVYNSKAYQSSNASLDNALCQIENPDGSRPFSSYCNTPEARAAPLVGPGAAGGGNSSSTGSTTTTPGTTPSTTPSTTPGSVVAPPVGGATSVPDLLAKAKASFAAADAALKTGDLAGYQADIQRGISYVNQAQAVASGTKTGGTRR